MVPRSLQKVNSIRGTYYVFWYSKYPIKNFDNSVIPRYIVLEHFYATFLFKYFENIEEGLCIFLTQI